MSPDAITFSGAVYEMQQAAFDKGYNKARKEARLYLVSSLLFALKEERDRHPYLVSGLHRAIEIVSAQTGMPRAGWREFLDEEDFNIMFYIDVRDGELP